MGLHMVQSCGCCCTERYLCCVMTTTWLTKRRPPWRCCRTQRVRWARAHDSQAAAIAAAGQALAVRHLNRRARLCYLRLLLQQLAARMRCVGRHGHTKRVLSQRAHMCTP